MKKRDAVSVMLIVLLMLISSGCQPPYSDSNKNADSTSQSQYTSSENGSSEEITASIEPLFTATGCNTDDDYAAVAHLGYDLSESAVADAVAEHLSGFNKEEYSEKIERLRCEGDEYYLIIPKYTDSVITVYHSNEDSQYDESSPIGVFHKPVVISCNVSDIIPNTVVKIEYTDESGIKNCVTVSPFLSLMDGSLCDTEHIFEF